MSQTIKHKFNLKFKKVIWLVSLIQIKLAASQLANDYNICNTSCSKRHHPLFIDITQFVQYLH